MAKSSCGTVGNVVPAGLVRTRRPSCLSCLAPLPRGLELVWQEQVFRLFVCYEQWCGHWNLGSRQGGIQMKGQKLLCSSFGDLSLAATCLEYLVPSQKEYLTSWEDSMGSRGSLQETLSTPHSRHRRDSLPWTSHSVHSRPQILAVAW